MFRGDSVDEAFLQVLSVRDITTEDVSRTRIVVSDGENYGHGMLGERMMHLVSEDRVRKNSIIKVNGYQVNNVGGRQVLIIRDCEFIRHMDTRLGSPSPLGDMSSAPASSTTAGGAAAERSREPFREREAQRSSAGGRSAGGGGGGGYRGGGGGGLHEDHQPIKTLNPYQQSWRIKARCTMKGQIREYTNARGAGKVFSVNLLDGEGSEIQATMFGETADKFYPIFDKGKVYYVSRGKIVMARKQFTHIKNDYAINLYESSEVSLVHGGDDAIMTAKYRFEPISSLPGIKEDSYIDVAGCVADVDGITTIRTKKGADLEKREVTICDEGGAVRVTLWGEKAQKYDESALTRAVLVCKAKVSDFGGRSLSANSVEITPDIERVKRLVSWANRKDWQFADVEMMTTRGGGAGRTAARLTIEETIEHAQRELGGETKTVYTEMVAMITAISHSREKLPMYKASPDSDNNAKVVEDGTGKYYCAKTNSTYESYRPRYILRFAVMDHTGKQWMSCFHETAETMLGRPAEEMESLASDDGRGFEEMFEKATFKLWKLKVRGIIDSYQDERQIKYSVIEAKPVDMEDEMSGALEDRLLDAQC
jgi:replication factor A1